MAIIFSFEEPPYLMPLTVAVHTTATDPVDERIASLSCSFALRRPERLETPSSVILRAENGWLEVLRASPSFRWRSPSRRPPRPRNNALRDCEAASIAQTFLKERAVWRAPSESESFSRTVLVDGVGREWRPEVQVRYSHAIDGLRTVGPGFRTVVTLSDEGAVSEVFQFARALGQEVHRAPTDRTLARTKLATWGLAIEESYSVRPSERLGYLILPPRQPQPFLVPAFVYNWLPDGSDGPVTRAISAIRAAAHHVESFRQFAITAS